jgi:hypothetical protein
VGGLNIFAGSLACGLPVGISQDPSRVTWASGEELGFRALRELMGWISFQIGDEVRDGAGVGIVTDVGTILIQVRTSEGR